MALEELLSRDAFLLVYELRLFWFILTLYLVAIICYVSYLFAPDGMAGKTAHFIVAFAALIHTLMILFRGLEASRLPFQTLYECLSFFAWTSVVTYLYIHRRWKDVHIPGLIVTLIALLASIYALAFRSPEITPLSPALQSQWFFWHVVLAFMSYAVFVVSCAMEISYLILKPFILRGLGLSYGLSSDSLYEFHLLSHRLVLFGFPFLTFGIISGAAWADQAWGRYWAWDPKETWSLVTWTAFAVYLHAMTIPGWRGLPASLFNITGFICMIITFLGLNWLSKLLGIESLHIYS